MQLSSRQLPHAVLALQPLYFAGKLYLGFFVRLGRKVDLDDRGSFSEVWVRVTLGTRVTGRAAKQGSCEPVA